MKPTLPLLAVSLAANAALLAFVLLRSPASAPSPSSGAAPTHPATGLSVPATGPLAASDEAALARSREILATGDLPTLVSRLRAAGFSASDVRGIVGARLSQIYGAKRVAAIAYQEVVPYWRSSMSFPEDPKAGAAITGLFREQTSQLKQLLGTDAYPDDAWSKLIHNRQYGYLPADKMERIQGILSDYTDMRDAINREARGWWLPEDQDKQALLEKEKQADLAKILTPEEIEAYQLHTSQTANNLRWQLSAFQPTEDEFRAIYHLSNDGVISNQRPLTPAQLQQLEIAIGADRAAEFAKTTDPEYVNMNRFVTRLDLPAAVGSQVMALQRDFLSRINQVQSDNSLNPAAKQAAMAALASEADIKLPALLGDQGYRAYQTSLGGWMGMLHPPKIVSGTGGK